MLLSESMLFVGCCCNCALLIAVGVSCCLLLFVVNPRCCLALWCAVCCDVPLFDVCWLLLIVVVVLMPLLAVLCCCSLS